jgi:hypothetical protein
VSESNLQSWHWCRRCHAYVDLKDAGDVFPQCERCGSRHVEVRQLEPESRPVDPHVVAGFVRRAEQTVPKVFSQRAARVRVRKHLPADKKDLRVLVKTGFWFCYADDCRQITERNDMGECVCCGAALDEEANWTPPALQDQPSTQEKAA